VTIPERETSWMMNAGEKEVWDNSGERDERRNWMMNAKCRRNAYGVL
jgi:hypothetical protein